MSVHTRACGPRPPHPPFPPVDGKVLEVGLQAVLEALLLPSGYETFDNGRNKTLTAAPSRNRTADCLFRHLSEKEIS